MTTSACPSDEELAGHLAGALDAERAAAVADHLDGCAGCRAIVIGAVRGGVVTLGQVSEATVTARDRARRGETLQPGTTVGRYRIVDLLGAGGMGVVYIAHDTALDREVALKVLRTDLAGDAATLAERLVRESRLMAKASHPGVIVVHDVGRDGDQVYVAMELIRGETLGKWLKRAPRTVDEVVAMFRRAGAGLGAAHKAGMVHRDFKPDNVLVELDGDEVRRVLVTDFGVARAVAGAGEAAGAKGDGVREESTSGSPSQEIQLTATGVAVGTPAYMAPEQLSGKDVDERADVFGFAVALWEALYGVRPFTGATPGLIRAAMNQLPTPPAQRGGHAARGRVPGWITRALLAALIADPRARTPTIAALLAALDGTPRTRRRRRIAALIAGLVVSGGAVLAIAAWPADAAAPDPCAARVAALDARWNPARVADARAALAGTAVDPAHLAAALAELDEVTTGWRKVNANTCKAQPAAIAACLDARLLELGAVGDELVGGTRVAIEYPHLLVKLVGDVGRCPTGAPALREASVPDDPALQRAVGDLRRKVFAIDDLREGGDYQAALAALPALEAGAKTVGWDKLTAEVEYLRGSIESVGSDTEHGVELLRQAAATAQRAHHESIAASVWIVLAHTTALDLHQTDRAFEYLDYAAPAIERLGSPADLHAQLLYTRGIVEADAHQDDVAEAHFREALAIAKDGAPQLEGICVQGLAFVLEDRERFAEAAAQYQRALALQIEQFGEGHPNEVTYRGRLAYNLACSGQYDEAIVQARRGLAIAEATLDELQIDRMYAHDGLSEVLYLTGHLDEALVEIDKAVTMTEAIVGARSQIYGEVLTTKGQLLMAADRAKDARAVFSRSCAVLEYTIPEESIADSLCQLDDATALLELGKAEIAGHVLDHVEPDVRTSDDPGDIANFELVRGDVLAASGRAKQAVVHYQAALAGFAHEADTGLVGLVELGLSHALAKSDPAAATEHATRAVAILAAAWPKWRPDLKKAEAWLERRARP